MSERCPKCGAKGGEMCRLPLYKQCIHTPPDIAACPPRHSAIAVLDEIQAWLTKRSDESRLFMEACNASERSTYRVAFTAFGLALKELKRLRGEKRL